jgi:DeoR/GlpR family transcriptional regulator of sugar metabolism
MQYLKENKRITVDEICQRFDVSRDTARRDIVKLEEQGKIIRVRGGAILPTLSKEMPNFKERLQMDTEVKKAIGKLASTLIHDGDYLYISSSTTTRYTVEFMNSKQNVVITNSIDLASLLVEKEGITIHMLGGKLFNEHGFVYGTKAIEMLSQYYVDKLFIGTCGITKDGLSSLFEEESYLIREAIQRADQVIVLADHSKFGKREFHQMAGFEDIDLIITDKEPSPEIIEQLQKYNVEILLANDTEKN